MNEDTASNVPEHCSKEQLKEADGFVQRWSALMSDYFPERETLVVNSVHTAMSKVDSSHPKKGPLRVAVLGSGPGLLATRIYHQLHAHYGDVALVALERDPSLVRLGQDTCGRHLKFMRADLRSPEWTQALDAHVMDLVVTAYTTHYLPPDELAGFYANVRSILADTGVFLNVDAMPEQPRVALAEQQPSPRGADSSTEDPWQLLLQDIHSHPRYHNQLANWPSEDEPGGDATFGQHREALTRAGFAQLEALAGQGASRVLLAQC